MVKIMGSLQTLLVTNSCFNEFFFKNLANQNRLFPLGSAHDWCNKDCGMCYPVCEMVHIKEPLLLIDKSSLCGGSRFPFSLSEWSLTICLTPYN